MFLVLVLLLGHSAPANPPGALGASPSATLRPDGSVEWSPAGAGLDDPAQALTKELRQEHPVGAGEGIVLIRVPDKSGLEPSVVVTEAGQVVSVPTKAAPIGSGTWLVGAIVPTNQPAGSPPVRIGISRGAWETAGAVELNRGLMGKKSGEGFVRMVRPDQKLDGKKAVQLVVVDTAMPTDELRNAYQVRVIGKAGKPLLPAGPSERNSSADVSLMFKGEFQATTRVVLLRRTYKWIPVP